MHSWHGRLSHSLQRVLRKWHPLLFETLPNVGIDVEAVRLGAFTYRSGWFGVCVLFLLVDVLGQYLRTWAPSRGKQEIELRLRGGRASMPAFHYKTFSNTMNACLLDVLFVFQRFFVNVRIGAEKT